MAVTSPTANPRHACDRRCTEAFHTRTKRGDGHDRWLGMAFVALALGLPAVIGATMLGSKF
jgi:hypothetical protein